MVSFFFIYSGKMFKTHYLKHSFECYIAYSSTKIEIKLHCFVCDSLLGSASKHEFQAETKKLLDIVARSLYSEKEVRYLQSLLAWQNCFYTILGKMPDSILAVRMH